MVKYSFHQNRFREYTKDGIQRYWTFETGNTIGESDAVADGSQ